ncbi:MAG: class I SAM-dependent methyltransferase [Chloroflexota bacterium]
MSGSTPDKEPISPAAGDPMSEAAARATLSILGTAFAAYGPRDFAVRLWNGREWPAALDQPPRFTLVLNHPGALRRMFLPPSEASLGEAFVRGDFDLEGDLVAAMGLSDAIQSALSDVAHWPGVLRQLLALPSAEAPAPHWRGAAHLSGQEHSAGRDRQAITYHYDLPGDFYALFLGQRMQYSCAYFQDQSDDLDTAQNAKLEHICRKLRLRKGERLLDVGCGWGGLIAYAAEHYGVEALGITISQGQAYIARRRLGEAGLSNQARVEICDYRELDEWGGFDKIVSIGMFEHVGRQKLPVYFQHALNLLKPGGLFLNHGIASMYLPEVGRLEGLVRRALYSTGGFIRNYVFPDGELLPISYSLGAAERAGFEVRDLESLREHYALTLRHWLRALERKAEEARLIVDEPTYRVWRLYIAGCAYNFDAARINLYQALLVKPGAGGTSGMPLTRSWMYDDKEG